MNTPPTEDALLQAALATLDPLPDPDPTAMESFAYATPPEAAYSLTLAGLDVSRRPLATTACETCPNSMWFASPQEVKCYCRVMFLVTWSSQEPHQITLCDGLAIGPE